MNNTTYLLDIIEKNQKKLNDASEQIRVLRDYDPLINTDIRMTPYEIGKDIGRCEKNNHQMSQAYHQCSKQA